MEDAMFVDSDAMRRIAAVVRRVEGGVLPPDTSKNNTTPTTPVQIIKITGDLDTATGLYPATAWGYKHIGDGEDLFTQLIECRVRALNGEQYADGDWLLGRFSGKEEGGTLGVFVAYSGGEFVRWVKITEATPSGTGSTWTAKVQKKDTNSYIDGGNCRVKVIEGEVFQNGKKYLATLNGVVDDLPLFHAAGDTIFINDTCDEEGNPICDKMYMHPTFAIVENVDCETGEPL